MTRASAVVVGLGNDWRGDDVAGLAVARALRGHLPAGVTAIEHQGEPLGLLEAWERVEAAIVVDAAASGAPAGTVHRLHPLHPLHEPTCGWLRASSTHALGLLDVIELGRALERLPDHLIVYGIEGRDFAIGSGMTPEVARAVCRLTARLRDELSDDSVADD